MLYTSQTFNQEMTIRNFLLCDHDAVPLQPNDFLAPNLTNKQAEILELVTERRISVLIGGAGSGKSRCIAALACTFRNVILSAPTGKASRRIIQVCREYNPKVEAFTLHSLLGMATSDTNSAESRTKNNYNIPKHSLLIIDEASMIDIDMMFAVVNTAKDLNLGLLLVGDPNQLPPVGRGDIFTNTIEWAREYGYVIELTEIHRQVETNPIYKIGQHICKGVDTERVIEFVDGDTVQLITPSSYTDAITMAVELKKKYSRTPFDLQIITPWKKMVSAINSKINSGRVGFKPGDFVMCTNNISTADFDTFRARQRISFPIPEDPWVLQHLYKSTKIINDDGNGNFITDTIQKFERAVNGSCGIVLNNEVIIDENSEFVYLGNYMCQASAITVHKSQGNEWATVILVLYNTGNQQSNFVNKNLLYTAMTRAKRRLIIIGSRPEDLFYGIKREAAKRYSTDYLSTCGQFHK
jgi:exodeoxyribonuclease V alpha subunit